MEDTVVAQRFLRPRTVELWDPAKGGEVLSKVFPSLAGLESPVAHPPHCVTHSLPGELLPA